MAEPIEMLVKPYDDDTTRYMACWLDYEPYLIGIPEIWLDLLPLLVARRLVEHGYNPERRLIIKLLGADYMLVDAPLAIVAAPPLLNTGAPVKHAARCIYRGARHA